MAQGTPLRVWFVNVGHGDCTIVQFPGPDRRVMMVDICNSPVLDESTRDELLSELGWGPISRMLSGGEIPADIKMELLSYEHLLDDPIDVLKDELPGKDIFRFVLTHPDMDHMTGLHRLMQQEHSIDVLNFWDTGNTKRVPQKSGKGYDERDWDEYQRVRKSEANPKVLNLYRDARGDYYTQDSIDVLSPTLSLKDQCNELEDWNNLSQVLRISHGESSLLLPGDVETSAQELMVEHFGNGLKSTILKAPHHGRESGYHEAFAAAVNPQYTIVSVGKKPNSDASNKYQKHTAKKVFSTRFMGTIYAELFPDGEVRIWNSPKKGRARIDEELDALLEAIRVASRRNQAGLGI